MIADGYLIGDGSWELRIVVTNLDSTRTLRVKGDLHIGGVIWKLVEDIDNPMDWSDHALWWPDQNKWLLRNRSTLDQYGVQADAVLHFTPMHKTLKIQMPDLQFVDLRVDFSSNVFKAVVNICKDLTIRHPEELSLCRPLTQESLKRNQQGINYRNQQQMQQRRAANNNMKHSDTEHTSILLNSSSNHNSLDRSGNYTPNRAVTPIGSPYSATSTWRQHSYASYNGSNGTYSPNSIHSMTPVDGMGSPLDGSLASSPVSPSAESKNLLVRPRNLAERARMNVAWLDSSLSLMEQGVREFNTLLLRFKFYYIFDLNPKYDAVRINQLFEQAKWSLLVEEIDCTEDEMMMFAALQLQVNRQSQIPQPLDATYNDDDIDAALTDLQVTLEGSNIISSNGDITQIPELSDYLRFLKPKNFTLKRFRRYYFNFRDTTISLYKDRSDMGHSAPIHRIPLRGCEVTPDVNISQGKYGIKLEVPNSGEAMSEIWIRCENEKQYAKWMAACRLASKGKTMADSSYENEVISIEALLGMQRPAEVPVPLPNYVDISPDDYVAPRFLRKLKGKQITSRIMEAYANVKDISLLDAKMNYIKAWQALPNYGISLFVVRFKGRKKEELLGVASNRLMCMDLHTGDHIRTWRYSTMKAWNVNWEVKHLTVEFENEFDPVVLSCLSADCKIVHEYIGGYIFLSMRSKDQSQVLNEELFHKLTGGWL